MATIYSHMPQFQLMGVAESFINVGSVSTLPHPRFTLSLSYSLRQYFGIRLYTEVLNVE